MNRNYKPSKRNWVKLWVDEWLQGTTRFELSEKQRSIWIDLLAMAGKSRFPGIVASGKYDDGFRGYPLSYLTGSLVYDPVEFQQALDACEKYGKIRIEHRNHDGSDNLVIYINNWEKYQSEYLRQRKYQDAEQEEEIDNSFQSFCSALKESNNKIGVLVEAFKSWHKDATNEDLDPEILGGRIGKLCSMVNKDYGFLLQIIWDTASKSISGNHLNYIQAVVKNKISRDKEKSIRQSFASKPMKRLSEVVENEKNTTKEKK